MIGGFQQVEQTEEHRSIVNNNKAQIISKLNLPENTDFKIVQVFRQVVGGLFYWFHL